MIKNSFIFESKTNKKRKNFIKKIKKYVLSTIFKDNSEENYNVYKILGIRFKFKKNNKFTYKQLCLNSKYWNPSWYLKTYRHDFYKFEAINYYLEKGWREGESPSQYFNSKYYINKYNIKDEIPLIHYLTKGKYLCCYPDNKNNFKSNFDEKNIQNYLEYKKQRTSKGVIYTCITSDYDDINEIKAYKFINKDWDYVCFTDNQGQIEKGQIGIWQMRPLVYNESDNTRKNRWHKFHPHILFPQYSQSIYIDANINILTSNIFDIINNSENNLLLPEHFNTPCIYKEFQWALSNNIDNKDNIEKLYEIIKKSNMPINYGFTENNLIYRKHNEKDIVDLMDEWWYLLKNYAKRDQLSFVWLLWKRGIEIEDITFKNTRIDTDNFYVFDHKKSREKVLVNL